MALKYAGMGYGMEDVDAGESMYRLKPALGAHQLSFGEEKPAKKAKMSGGNPGAGGGVGGGLIARFLNSATMGYERKGTRVV